MEFYSLRMIKQVEKEVLKNFLWEGFRFPSIPKPPNLKAEGLRPRGIRIWGQGIRIWGQA